LSTRIISDSRPNQLEQFQAQEIKTFRTKIKLERFIKMNTGFKTDKLVFQPIHSLPHSTSPLGLLWIEGILEKNKEIFLLQNSFNLKEALDFGVIYRKLATASS
jgi:hypothetical protein